MKTKYKKLRKTIIKESNKKLETTLLKAKTDLNNVLSQYNKQYKGTKEQQKEKFKKWIVNKLMKETDKKLSYLKRVQESEDFKEEFIITIQSTKSRMWGYTFKSYTNKDFVSEVISGCGYCKRSTATAQALNSNLSILKLLFTKKEKELSKHKGKNNNEIHREILGYGAGYSNLPNFEGGVGVNCHERILDRVGLKMELISDVGNSEVYLIKKK